MFMKENPDRKKKEGVRPVLEMEVLLMLVNPDIDSPFSGDAYDRAYSRAEEIRCTIDRTREVQWIQHVKMSIDTIF